MTQDERRRPVPARLDQLPETDRLEIEMRRSLPPGTAPRPPARQVALDATRSVQVVVDAWGQVEDVTIDRLWRSRLSPEQLLSALLATYQAARSQATGAFAMARFAAREAGLDPPALDDRRAYRRREPLLVPLGPAADRSARRRRIRELRAQIAEQRQQRKQEEQSLAAARRLRERTGPHGLLMATVQFGVVSSITGEPRRLRYSDTGDLQRDAVALMSEPGHPLARASTH